MSFCLDCKTYVNIRQNQNGYAFIYLAQTCPRRIVSRALLYNRQQIFPNVRPSRFALKHAQYLVNFVFIRISARTSTRFDGTYALLISTTEIPCKHRKKPR